MSPLFAHTTAVSGILTFESLTVIKDTLDTAGRGIRYQAQLGEHGRQYVSRSS